MNKKQMRSSRKRMRNRNHRVTGQNHGPVISHRMPTASEGIMAMIASMFQGKKGAR